MQLFRQSLNLHRRHVRPPPPLLDYMQIFQKKMCLRSLNIVYQNVHLELATVNQRSIMYLMATVQKVVGHMGFIY